MTQFTFKVCKLGVMPEHQDTGLTNVIYSVAFDVTGTDGEFSHTVHRSIGLGSPDPADFVQMDQLTEAQLIEFAKSAFAPDDMRVIQNEIQEAIDRQKSPAKSPVEIAWPLQA